MRLELGSMVNCADEPYGELAAVVIDATERRVTHLVVEPQHEPWAANLVPVALARPAADGSDDIALHATVEDVRRLPPVHEVGYVRLEGFPADNPAWDVGVQDVLALPRYPSHDLQPAPIDFAARYDRIPKSGVEIRAASPVDSADGHRLGRVGGLVVGSDGAMTHLVLERGEHPAQREVAIPVAAVASVETDAVALASTKAEVEALPATRARRRPPAAPQPARNRRKEE
jgi:hypothetical protein